jgi:hypothetical protein
MRVKWGQRIGIGSAALVAIVLVLPFFVSLNDHIPRIEQEASARLGEPVSIRSLKMGLLPLPSLTMEGIAGGETQDITVARVTVSPQDQLSGRVNAHVSVPGSSATVPLNVSGTLQSPLLIPTGDTLAGAGVGTAIMGPGVGTSLGAKVGGWVEGLFGGKEEPKK